MKSTTFSSTPIWSYYQLARQDMVSLNKEKGCLSLARSFMHAGTPSLLVSLWQVNDYSTAMLMENYYQNLNEGLPKDEALTLAKKSYIQQVKGLGTHPAFWSPFIQLGDATPITIQQKSHKKYYWIGGVLLVLILIGILQFIKKRKSLV